MFCTYSSLRFGATQIMIKKKREKIKKNKINKLIYINGIIYSNWNFN